MSRIRFQLEATSPGSRARAGRLNTRHHPAGRDILTPLFMPVGTQATVRGQTLETLSETGSQILLANTYHLMHRPGPEVFEKLGGIHRFMGWPGSVLTDSGGFQIFSLQHARDMSEEGAHFRHPRTGEQTLLTPERSVAMQASIGSDIAMALDACIPSKAPEALARDAMELTHRWAKRSLEARGDSPQALFGIVQGACFPELRRESAETLRELPFDGFAIGGLAVGESRAEREQITEITAALLPADRPRYLMGVGTPVDLLEAVHRGVDLFDCILPTALAQQGQAFTLRGKLDLRRSVYRLEDSPLEAGCPCSTCRRFSRAYLHHLIKSREVLGWTLIGTHNLALYHRLMSEVRASVVAGSFLALYRERRESLVAADPDFPVRPPRASRKSKRRPRELGAYELYQSPHGFHSIRHRPSGEVMHAVTEPAVEARKLYVDQPGLVARVQSGPLTIWDVGLGAATNAMAAISACADVATPERPLRLVSFENDLDSLRLALHYPNLFAHLRHPGPAGLLERGFWRSNDGAIHWELRAGEFREQARNALAADVLFFDPFSPKTDTGLWTLEVFRELARLCPRAELITYSNSTAIRERLLAAGWFVAPGAKAGPKADTTRAFSCAPPDGALLGTEWLERWRRSSARDPALAPLVEGHPQFRAAVTAAPAIR